jgi:hypothetical protein
MKRFTVKDLRNIIAGLDDETIVLTSAGDHSYLFAYAEVSTVLTENYAYGQYTEDHGEQYTPEAEYGERVPALILG